MSDKFRQGAALGCGADRALWLRNHDSLTQRIQQRCPHFAVRSAGDESALRGIAPQQLAWSREVFLYGGGQPMVFAHSAFAHEHLHGAWSGVRMLANKPLGARVRVIQRDRSMS